MQRLTKDKDITEVLLDKLECGIARINDVITTVNTLSISREEKIEFAKNRLIDLLNEGLITEEQYKIAISKLDELII